MIAIAMLQDSTTTLFYVFRDCRMRYLEMGGGGSDSVLFGLRTVS